jgi:hypothetical protein
MKMKRDSEGGPGAGANRTGVQGDSGDGNGKPYNAEADQSLGVELGNKGEVDFTPPKPNPLYETVYAQLPVEQLVQGPTIYELTDDAWAKLCSAPPCKLNAALKRACQDFADERGAAFVIVDPKWRVLVYREPKSWVAH